MESKEITAGVVHDIPDDLHESLFLNTELLEKWNGLTPLARNEWICWVISVKKAGTRETWLRIRDNTHGTNTYCAVWNELWNLYFLLKV